jgi:hypothetical protein
MPECRFNKSTAPEIIETSLCTPPSSVSARGYPARQDHAAMQTGQRHRMRHGVRVGFGPGEYQLVAPNIAIRREAEGGTPGQKLILMK